MATESRLILLHPSDLVSHSGGRHPLRYYNRIVICRRDTLFLAVLDERTNFLQLQKTNLDAGTVQSEEEIGPIIALHLWAKELAEKSVLMVLDTLVGEAAELERVVAVAKNKNIDLHVQIEKNRETKKRGSRKNYSSAMMSRLMACVALPPIVFVPEKALKASKASLRATIHPPMRSEEEDFVRSESRLEFCRKMAKRVINPSLAKTKSSTDSLAFEPFACSLPQKVL